MRRILGFKGRKKKKGPTLNDTSNMLEKRGGAVDTKIQAIDKQLIQIKNKMRSTKSPSVKASLRKKAGLLLKKKKMYSRHQDSLMNQQYNVDNITLTTESMQTNLETVNAMKLASKDLKKQYKKINIDKVEDMRDEMEDLMYEAEEINDALGSTFDVGDEVDETEIDDELDLIEDELGEDTGACLDSLDEPVQQKESGNDMKQLEADLL